MGGDQSAHCHNARMTADDPDGHDVDRHDAVDDCVVVVSLMPGKALDVPHSTVLGEWHHSMAYEMAASMHSENCKNVLPVGNSHAAGKVVAATLVVEMATLLRAVGNGPQNDEKVDAAVEKDVDMRSGEPDIGLQVSGMKNVVDMDREDKCAMAERTVKQHRETEVETNQMESRGHYSQFQGEGGLAIGVLEEAALSWDTR